MTDRRTHVAVVDDEEDSVQLFTEALKLQGYPAKGFNNPIMAIEYLYTHHSEFSLILTDIRMPGMNGFQLAKLVHQMDKEIKIICMSAFEIYDGELEETPMDDFMKKPIHIPQLVDIIEKQLKLKQYN